MTNLIKILAFFRILDENKQLSLTNLAVILVLIKMTCCMTFTLESASILLTTLGAYNFKRYLAKDKPAMISLADESLMELQQLKDDVSKLKLTIGFKHKK